MTRVEEIIRATRVEFEPSSADRERVKRRLFARAAGASVAASLVSKGSLGAVTPTLAGQSVAVLAKLFFGSMFVTWVGIGAVVAVTRAISAPAKTPALVKAPALVAPPAMAALPTASSAAESASAAMPAPSSSSREPPSRGATSRGSLASTPLRGSTSARRFPFETNPFAADGLEAELDLLRQVRQASAGGDLERARQLLDALDRDHPHGSLLEERAALRAVTECQAGGGRTTAEEFLRRYPRSVYLARVHHMCGTKPPAVDRDAETPHE